MSYNDPEVKIDIDAMSRDLGPVPAPTFVRERRRFGAMLHACAKAFDALADSDADDDTKQRLMLRAELALHTSREFLQQ